MKEKNEVNAAKLAKVFQIQMKKEMLLFQHANRELPFWVKRNQFRSNSMLRNVLIRRLLGYFYFTKEVFLQLPAYKSLLLIEQY